MASQVPWNERILEDFIRLAYLSDEEAYIMRKRCKGDPVSKISQDLNLSESSIAKRVSLLKKKYDRIQAEYPERFPVRRFSKKETWMDNN